MALDAVRGQLFHAGRHRERFGLRALRVSRWVDGRLAEPEPVRAVVHSVFRRVANLRLGPGDLLSLSAPEVALAPNGVAIELPVDVTMGGLGFEPGQPAALDSMGLGVPDAHVEVTFSGATRWEPRPRVCRVASTELARRAGEARKLAIAEGESGSLLPLLWGREAQGGAVLTGVGLAARGAVALLSDGAPRCDGSAVKQAASRLAGLGPGLTPSGDDLLTGFAAAWTLSAKATGLPRRARTRVAIALLAGASGRASELGGAWLAHAVRGEVAEPMGQFFTALLGGAPGGMAPALRGVLALGATSGTDWMVGALLGADAALTAGARGRL